MKRSDFQSKDVTLAGYKYSKKNQEVKGFVVIAYGLVGNGHNTYMPFIDYYIHGYLSIPDNRNTQKVHNHISRLLYI